MVIRDKMIAISKEELIDRVADTYFPDAEDTREAEALLEDISVDDFKAVDTWVDLGRAFLNSTLPNTLSQRLVADSINFTRLGGAVLRFRRDIRDRFIVLEITGNDGYDVYLYTVLGGGK